MKNLRTLLIYTLTLLLSAVAIPADAQQRQDALYIFRNDGQFNAFFYGDISRICYSKIDTLGVEHDDYVTQEVWALDTVYRIPVTAIDSVAFVTPENKIRDDVFCPDKSIADYIIGGDSVNFIRLASNTPQELIPRNGQKVLIEEPSEYIPDGFVGRVILSELDPDGWLIVTEGLALHDIYERLVVKAAIGSGDNANARRYGLIDGTELSYVMEEPWTLPKSSVELSLTNSHEVIPEAISCDVSGTLSASATPTINSIRAFLFMDPLLGMKVDVKTDLSVEGEVKSALTISLNGRLDIGFHKDPFKKKISGLEFKINVGFFIEGSLGGFELNWTKPINSRISTYTVIDQNDLKALSNPTAMLMSRPTFLCNVQSTSKPGTFNYELPRKLSVGMGLSANATAKFGIPFEKFKKLPDDITKRLEKHVEEGKLCGFKLYLGIDLGGKLEAKLPLTLLDQLSNMKTFAQISGLFGDLLSSQPVYKKLDEETEITLSAYNKAGGELSLGSWKVGFTPNITFSSSPHGLVPHITGISMDYDREEKPFKPWRIKLLSPISRNILSVEHVGFLVTDLDGKEITKYAGFPWYDEDGKKGYYSRVFTDIDPGKDEPVTYVAYPLVNFHGVEMLPDYKKKFTLDAARFDIEKRQIFAYEDVGYVEENAIEVIPNMSNVVVKAEAKWLKGPFWNSDLNRLEIGWQELPDTVNTRRGVYRLYGFSSDGKDTLTVDSVVVTQYRSFIELKPNSLDFEAKGGKQFVAIGKTNLTGLKVSVLDDFVDAKLVGDTIWVTAYENVEEEGRGCYVYVEGKNLEGNNYQTYIVVSQEGLGSPESDPFVISQMLLSSVFNLSCKNSYKQPPFEGWEPTDRAEMGFSYDKGDTDRTAAITVIDDNKLHLECIEQSEYSDPDYPEAVANTKEVFSADFTKIEGEDMAGNDVIHIKVSNVRHVHEYTVSFKGIGYTEHCEYTVSPNSKFHTVAFPAIYDYDGNLQLRGKLIWSGSSDTWDAGFSMKKYYEEFSFPDRPQTQKYNYEANYLSGITLQIEFEPNSMWDSWLEGKQVDDFGY